ncbi:MAG: carbohydrate ABC transporter permease, partial [Firmicutes bacterium]|nr:carbohydrate ABC transporter permease [Bacillota bacterium]
MAKNKISNKIKRSRGEEIFNVFNVAFMVLMIFICAYPLWYVVCASFSNADSFVIHEGLLWWPVDFDLLAYKR